MPRGTGPRGDEVIKVSEIRLEESWKTRLSGEFQQPYMEQLKLFLKGEAAHKRVIYPPGPEIFMALDRTPFESVKVVVLGQDPYHGPSQAHGMSFSVRPGVHPPPSLVNIYKELESDLGIAPPGHGFLEAWAGQGVLLLNAVLTVTRGLAGSHAGKGWETFTDRIVELLNQERQNLAFVLWGSYAQKKGAFIDRTRHLVLESPHPSPFSASRGFLGSRPFSKINAYLVATGQSPIDWRLPPAARV